MAVPAAFRANITRTVPAHAAARTHTCVPPSRCQTRLEKSCRIAKPSPTAALALRSHGRERRQSIGLRASASGSLAASPAASEPPFKWGADMKNLGISVAVAVVVWFLPPPTGVTAQAWHLLAIFLGTIVGIITQPLPLGAVAMLGLGATMLTKTLTFAAAFSAFASEIP